MKDEQKKHSPFLLASLGALQNGLVGGLIYGWASIDSTLLAAPMNEGGSGLSLRQTTDIFSWASSVGMLSSLLLGYILDRLGPRFCSAVSHLFIASGSFLFAVAPAFECRFALTALGACLMSFGGPGIQLSIVHLANLFPENKYFAMTCLNGTISISFIVFVLFDYIWARSGHTLGVPELFTTLGVVTSMLLVASFIYWPDAPFEIEEVILLELPHEKTLDYFDEPVHFIEQGLDTGLREGDPRVLAKHESFVLSKKAQLSGNEALISLKDRPFLQQLYSPTYIRIFVLFVVTCFVANFYVASFSTEMVDCSFLSAGDQHHLAQIFTTVISFGFIPSLLLGRLLDAFGIDVCNAITLLCGQVQVLILIFLGSSFTWKVISFIPYVFFRQFLFPNFIAALMGRLGFKYFGLLNGIGFAVSGLAQLFMSALVGLIESHCDGSIQCKRETWVLTHWVEFAGFTVLLSIPILDHWDEVLKKRMIRETFGSRRSLTSSLASINESRPLISTVDDGLEDYLSVGPDEWEG